MRRAGWLQKKIKTLRLLCCTSEGRVSFSLKYIYYFWNHWSAWNSRLRSFFDIFRNKQYHGLSGISLLYPVVVCQYSLILRTLNESFRRVSCSSIYKA